MERLPHGRHYPRHSWRADSRSATPRPAGVSRAWSRVAVVTGALMLGSLAIPAGITGAAPATGATKVPSTLKATIAEINKLSNEIDALGQQYDALKIQLAQAKREARLARETAKRDQKLLASGEAAIGQIAAAGYMNGQVSPTLQLLQTSNPQEMLNQTSIMMQLQRENGDKVNLVSAAETAAKRASLTAIQEQAQATKLTAAMNKKVAAAQAKESVLNSAAYADALAEYQKTGHYPAITPTGDSVPVQALRKALTRRGDPYVWAAAGPDEFDCSGLVVWAYAQIGISLPHYTGDLWNSGPHIARDQLEPGDLVFFYPGIEHVGIYVGDGLMLDAPSTGQVVQIQPVMWNVYDGAVRIA